MEAYSAKTAVIQTSAGFVSACLVLSDPSSARFLSSVPMIAFSAAYSIQLAMQTATRHAVKSI